MKAASLLALLGVVAVSAVQAQVPTLGERIAKSSCAQCHSFGKDEPHGVGPNLHALIGRPAAAATGYTYSKEYLASMQGKTWDRALLERWLTDAQAVAPGNGMVYFQDDPKKRAVLIEYLQSLN